jgi:hypothetical protein
MTRTTARRHAWLALAAGAVVALALGEATARLVGPRPPVSLWPQEYHPRLGYIPRPRYRAPPGAPWRVHTEADGVRSNGAARPAGRPILAVGDSFTFGDEVADEDTWPARLERELGVPVLNGGVPAYGFDQTVLRAEELLAARPVRGLIVSIIADDLRRCQLSVFCGAPKPFFDAHTGRLELRNVPVPRPLAGRPLVAGLLRRSHLLNWIRQATTVIERREHRRGRRVAHLLLQRLGDQARRGLPVLLLIQGPTPDGRAPAPRFHASVLPVLQGLEASAQRNGLTSLNLVAAAWEEFQRAPARRGELFLRDGEGHMTPDGNAWVAGHVARALRERGWVER